MATRRQICRIQVLAKNSPNFCDSLRRIWRVLSQFGEFGELGEFGEGRLDCFIHKNIFFFVYKTTQIKNSLNSPNSPPYLARTRHIRHSIHSPTFAKMRLAFDTFARVVRHFGEFGASGHCLVNIQVKYLAKLLFNIFYSLNKIRNKKN